jgi:hypothetical protein
MEEFLKWADTLAQSGSLVFLFIIARRVGAWEAFVHDATKELERLRNTVEDLSKRVYELFGQLKK